MNLLRRAACSVLPVVFLAWPAATARAGTALGGEHTITVDGTSRSYIVHVPPHVPSPAPVVFVFHGGGGRPQAIERKTELDALADRNGFIAVYPEGITTPSGRGGSWNVGGAITAVLADDVGFVRGILADLRRRTAVDPSRIYAAGHSMGGVFAYRLACEMSETFAAIAAVSSTMVEPACRPASPVAVLHLHGTADERIPVEGGHGTQTAMPGRQWPVPRDGVAQWARLDQCHGTPTQTDEGGIHCTSYAECRASVKYCEIAGGGHPWPDDASQRAWRFFAAHPRPTQAR